jgi:hypothetical protein
MTATSLFDYIINAITYNKLTECNDNIRRDYLDYPTPELDQILSFQNLLLTTPNTYKNIRSTLYFIIKGIKYNNLIEIHNTPEILIYIISAIAEHELIAINVDILRLYKTIPEPPIHCLRTFEDLQEFISDEYPNIKNVLRIIIEHLNYTKTSGFSGGNIVIPAPPHVTDAHSSAIASLDVPTKGYFNTRLGVMNAKQFLSNVHNFTISDIIDIVDANKDLFNNEYAELILSMHTGASGTTPGNNDPITYACYGMLFNVNPKVVAFNLGKNGDKITKKYLPSYINGSFNKKDLLIDIIKSSTAKNTLKHFAKSHFTYVELLEINGKLHKNRIDLIKLALIANN